MRRFCLVVTLLCAAGMACAHGAKDAEPVAQLDSIQKPGYGEGGGSGAASLPHGADDLLPEQVADTTAAIPDLAELSSRPFDRLSGTVKVRAKGGVTTVRVKTGAFRQVGLSFPKPADPENAITVDDIAALKGQHVELDGYYSADKKWFTVFAYASDQTASD